MYSMSDITSHKHKNRLLVGCLSVLVGVPLMCCCLLGIFNFVFPAINQVDPKQFPSLLVWGGLGVFGILFVIALGAIAVYLFGRKFPGLKAPDSGEDQHSRVAHTRQISLIVLIIGVPLCFISTGVFAYLIVHLLR
jgi:hypothetical protein